MFKQTLTLRRAIVLVVVLGLLIPAVLITGYSWFEVYDRDVQKRTNELLQQNADVLANGMQEPLWNINTESGSALLDAMMTRNEDIVRIEVRDTALGIFVHEERPERRIGYTASTEKQVVYRGSVIGSVQIEVGSTRLRRILVEGLQQQFAALAAQIVLSIVLILILLEKRLVGPLQRLGKGAERLAGRELDMPFTWSRLDEIGLLSRRLEATRISLRSLFKELDQKNQELEQDIDKRKRVEQELHEREARFRALVEQSPIAIIEWDHAHRVIEWNAAAERIFGYSREEAIGQDASFINIGGTSPMQSAGIASLDGDGLGHNVAENMRNDGQIIVCQWSHAQIDDESGHTGRLLSMAEDITEKRRAEDAQRLSEAKFAGAFQCNPDSVSITRLSDGVFLDVNQTFEKTTGYLHDEWLGKNALELNLWQYPEENDVLIGQLNMFKMVRDYPWTMRTKTGELRSCMSNATIFAVGQELYLLAVIRDVTDQYLMEAQKAEADRALLRLAQGTQELAGESFLDSLVADLASALRVTRAFIGLNSDQHPGRIRTVAAYENGQLVPNFEYDIPGAPCEFVMEGDICVFTSGVQDKFPKDLALAQGAWESYAGAPLRDREGNTIGVLTVMHTQPLGNADLVKSLLQVFSERASSELERKRAEEALRSSEERFSTIFQSSPVAMFLTEEARDYEIYDVNGAFERLFKRTRDEVSGKNTLELGMYLDPQSRVNVIRGVRENDTLHQHEYWMVRGDGGKVLVQLSVQTFVLRNEKFVIYACEDVTDKRRIEKEILELNANLEQRVIERTDELQRANMELAATLTTLNMAQEELVRSEKLAALGSLVAGIAHELNTPIGNSLMVASTLVDQTRTLTEGFADGSGMKRSTLDAYLKDSAKAGDILVRNLFRAANLVTSFKQVAVDQTSSQRRTFALSEVVSEILLTLSPTLRKTAFEVTQDIPDDLVLDSYPGPLGQVITNLVNNALLHGFEGRSTGKVSLSALLNREGLIELSVRDDGVGIPAANLNRIFDPFFTTKLGAGGSGLGLNITHNIVTGVLGGKVRVQSEVGSGTTFVLTLPTAAPQLQAEDVGLQNAAPR
ncbi:MAG TPA: PAS domain S-box protein [Burkholderiaceae bacterium]